MGNKAAVTEQEEKCALGNTMMAIGGVVRGPAFHGD
jgi:hypothetical protein